MCTLYLPGNSLGGVALTGNGCGEFLGSTAAQFNGFGGNSDLLHSSAGVFDESTYSSFQLDTGLLDLVLIGIIGLHHGVALVQLSLKGGVAGSGIVVFGMLLVEFYRQLSQTLGAGLEAESCISGSQLGAGGLGRSGIRRFQSFGLFQSLCKFRPGGGSAVSLCIYAASLDQFIQTAHISGKGHSVLIADAEPCRIGTAGNEYFVIDLAGSGGLQRYAGNRNFAILRRIGEQDGMIGVFIGVYSNFCAFRQIRKLQYAVAVPRLCAAEGALQGSGGFLDSVSGFGSIFHTVTGTMKDFAGGFIQNLIEEAAAFCLEIQFFKFCNAYRALLVRFVGLLCFHLCNGVFCVQAVVQLHHAGAFADYTAAGISAGGVEHTYIIHHYGIGCAAVVVNGHIPCQRSGRSGNGENAGVLVYLEFIYADSVPGAVVTLGHVQLDITGLDGL